MMSTELNKSCFFTFFLIFSPRVGAKLNEKSKKCFFEKLKISTQQAYLSTKSPKIVALVPETLP